MKARILKLEPVAPPPETVVLEMSVEEFAVLNRLVYKGLSGMGGIRTQVERTFMLVRDGLDPANQARVNGAAEFQGDTTTAVEEWFRS